MTELRRILKINGVDYHIAVNQYGEGKPTADTPGNIGVLYEDTNTGDLYKCVSGSVGAWVWKRLPTLDEVEKKFDKTGGNITGGLNVSNSYANGCGTLYKNNSVDADYGTVLSDTNKAGDMLELILNASTGQAMYRHNGNIMPLGIKKVEQTTTSTEDDGVNIVTITFMDNSQVQIRIGNGSQGGKGNDGVGISKIEQTTVSTEDDGNNVFTFTMTDGTQYNMTVQNGSKGKPGDSYILTDTDKSDIAAQVKTTITTADIAGAADTDYTALKARAQSLNSAETTPTMNGAIAWTYE